MKWLLIALLIVPVVAVADEYDDFSAFADTFFVPSADSLVYAYAGGDDTIDLAFVDPDSNWTHASRNSFFVGFETNVPGESWLEYGTSSDSTTWTDYSIHSDRDYFTHNHRATGLTASTQYWYAMVVEDERNNRLRSAVGTITTISGSGYTEINSSTSFPITLSASTSYLLTEDVSASLRAVMFGGRGITLDLNGYTLTYNANDYPNEGESWSASDDVTSTAPYGVFLSGARSGAVFNGTIKQGAGNNAGDQGLSLNPIYVSNYGGIPLRVGGVDIEWGGDGISAIQFSNGENQTGIVHNCNILDRGTGVDNRHAGNRAISSQNTFSVSAYRNLVKRSRHMGIVKCVDVYSNEVYIDSWSTNGYGIWPQASETVRDNKVLGTGYHFIGIGWPVDLDSESSAYDNNLIFGYGQGVAVSGARYSENGSNESLNGFRMTQYGQSTYDQNNTAYTDNVVMIHGQRGTTLARGFEIFSDDHYEGTVVSGNTVRVNAKDAATTAVVSCVNGHGVNCMIGTCGGSYAEDPHPVLYNDNTFISNRTLVNFADSYAGGSRHEFRDNTFVLEGGRSDAVSIVAGDYEKTTYNNQFIDNTWSGDALWSDYEFEVDSTTYSWPLAIVDYHVGHRLYITATDGAGNPLVGAVISVSDSDAYNTYNRSQSIAFSDTTDASGYAEIELLDTRYWYDHDNTTAQTYSHTDHVMSTSGFSDFSVDAALLATSSSPSNRVTINFGTGTADPSSNLTAPTKLTATSGGS